MTSFILLSVTVGALLGRGWTVLALLPAGVVVLLGIGAAGLLLGSAYGEFGATIPLSIVGLQIGYIAGAISRHTIPGAYLRRGRSRRFPARPANLG